MIYQGGAWPEEYAGSLFMNNIHGARLNRDTLEPRGSGFVGRHAPDFLMANDSWSQIINLKTGPDGQVYFIDWYDGQQCHDKNAQLHDRTNGRIFKLSYGDPKPVKVDLQVAPSDALDRPDRRPEPLVRRPRPPPPRRARGRPDDRRPRMAAVRRSAERPRSGASGRSTRRRELDDEAPTAAFATPTPPSGPGRSACREPGTGPARRRRRLATEFRGLAASDPSPVVRLALASALQRLPLDARWAILEALIAHAEDASDPTCR